MKFTAGLLAVAVTVLSWATISAGPIDNAQQFQQKAANSAMKKNYNVKPRKPVITTIQPQADTSKIINTGNAGTAESAANTVKNTGETVDKADKKEAVK